MFLLSDTLVTSASDLTLFSQCRFAFARRLDAKLGRDVTVPEATDAMRDRAAALGDEHELRILADYRAASAVVELPRPAPMTAETLSAAAAATQAALRGGAATVFQATLFDPAHRPGDGAGQPAIAFVGFADFLCRTEDGRYEVQDAKLARRAKVPALLQLAAYAGELRRIGVPVAPRAALLLGSGARSAHELSDLEPVYRRQRSLLHELIDARWAEVGPDGQRASAAPTAWGEVAACGSCEVCEPEVHAHRDLLLVAGLRHSQRDALRAAGIHTVDQLATLAERTDRPLPTVAHVSPRALRGLAEQAALQCLAERPQSDGAPPFRVIEPEALRLLPEPSPGDLFFDFEGDPLFFAPGPEAQTGGADAADAVVAVDAAADPAGSVQASRVWGIDYLFGTVDAQERFRAFWAHDLAQERRALLDFLDFVEQQRARYPGMHIYHYAPYEKTHLRSLAIRHATGEERVDALLRDGVLVDLYATVRGALRVGAPSYSIKALEPLYMGGEHRAGVTTADQSIAEYAEAARLRASADPADRARAQAMLDAIADYNRYDCVSTLRLRDWLRSLAADVSPVRATGDRPAAARTQGRAGPAEAGHAEGRAGATTLSQTSTLAAELLACGAGRGERERAALQLASAAIDYHERELKSFWWAHYDRLEQPREEWEQQRDVFAVDTATVVGDWAPKPRSRGTESRQLLLTGALAPGSSLSPGQERFAVYELPPRAHTCRVLDVTAESVTIEETVAADRAGWAETPTALTPGPPPRPGAQQAALAEWGAWLRDSFARGKPATDPACSLLLRTPRPRLGGDGETAAGGPAAEVVRTLLAGDRSTLAVQGPPGSGKTYLAARVIRALVDTHGWHIGVVAQSHRVVENVLAGVVRAGVPAEQVGKALQRGATDPGHPFTVIPGGTQQRFVRDLSARGLGSVTGGTAWDFANDRRYPRRSLDLLVIDEAGQFSIAATVAASVAARRVLLLGDPQQLPQVTQGTHPYPVDASALSWVLGDRPTMPDELGFFLDRSWRMHPALCAVVSELSYAGRLAAADRPDRPEVIEAGPPGLSWHPVAHAGNATESVEEAERVVALCRAALGGSVRTAAGDHAATAAPGKATLGEPATALAATEAGQGAGPRSRGPAAEAARERPLRAADILVIAAYNAQVDRIQRALAAAGMGQIRVGTVDRFQGQEGLIAIVSLAASTAADIPRGMEFLLMRNRLNVAISRAQWGCHLVSSAALGDSLPTSAEAVTALSGYLRLTEQAQRGWPA